MPQDYKHRIPAYRQRRQQRTRQFGLVAAAAGVFALLAGTGVYLLTRSEEQTAAETPAQDADPKSKTAKAPSVPQKPGFHPLQQPRFTFYKVLPEEEVIISESQLKTLKREESLGKPVTGTGYLVQAGSFTQQEDAEKLKDRLAELNVKAKLEIIKLDETVWYRVKLGPYGSLGDADKVRRHLRSNKIDSVVQQSRVVR